MAKNEHKATTTTPQVVVLVMDDSGSMEESVPGIGVKAKAATEGIRQMLMEMQAVNVNASGSRFFVSLLKFGTAVTTMAECQPPGAVKLPMINFQGKSGGTDMAMALREVQGIMERSLAKVRSQVQKYREKDSPPPLVMFFSDGENTGDPTDELAKKLHAISFDGGPIQVVAVGIGMKAEHFGVMEAIASKKEYTVNIDPAELPAFLAEVGTTFIGDGPTVEGVVRKFQR